MLRDVALRISELDARISRHQSVHKVHARLRPVLIQERDPMTPGARRANLRGRPQPDGPDSEAHIPKWREARIDQRDGRERAVDRQHNGTEHPARVCIALGLRNFTVAVRIDRAEYLRRHGHAGREVDFQIHTINIDGEAGRLQILIHSMRAGRRRGCEQSCEQKSERYQETAHAQGLANFAP